jgi:DUF1009 family protein
MRKWADGGCQGVAPKGKQVERQAIATKMAATNATAAAASKTLGEVNAQIAEHNSRLTAIAAQIEIAALDAAQVEFTNIRGEHAAAVEMVRKSTAKIFGLCAYLSNTGRSLSDRGEIDAAKRYFVRAEAAVAVANKMAKPDISQTEIMREADAWSRRVADLRSGA